MNLCCGVSNILPVSAPSRLRFRLFSKFRETEYRPSCVPESCTKHVPEARSRLAPRRYHLPATNVPDRAATGLPGAFCRPSSDALQPRLVLQPPGIPGHSPNRPGIPPGFWPCLAKVGHRGLGRDRRGAGPGNAAGVGLDTAPVGDRGIHFHRGNQVLSEG